MRGWIDDMDRAFESRVRLGIMSMLVVGEYVDFGTLRDRLQVTDGNLASHLAALEKSGYVEVRKRFVGRRPNTSYAVTEAGRGAFARHLDALERMIRGSGAEAAVPTGGDGQTGTNT